ncbi:MAG: pyruvate synthase [Polyangiaceae bacterium]|jgi:pyruvate ferredoxin oxidoreductase alpha subunit|nr:pyruvate synthase [Polyangiaceae bacterium]MBK8940380.1 pyruvate synthase [Polyangiaceae bacterium]
MSRALMTGNVAAAWGARLANVDYIPAFPITPQTEIIETLASWVDEGLVDAKLTMLESEHSMVTAAGAAAATGARVFTATSSQGLLYALEMLYAVAGWRVPFVMVNVSRGVASPITLEPDHEDILAARDSGFLQLHAATCQEVVDFVLLGYALGEDPRVRLPVLVNEDGFQLSFTREPVALPAASDIAELLGTFDPMGSALRGGNPTSQGIAVLDPSAYSYFRYEIHLASRAALAAWDEVAVSFAEITGRRYEPVEVYRADDAEVAIVAIGSFSTKLKEAVDRLRDAGQRVGLVRPLLLRPFPDAQLREALAGKKGVLVFDQNLSMGKGGVLHTEVCSALYGARGAPPIVASFIGGLGGRDLPSEEIYAMVDETLAAVQRGEAPPPRLLFTHRELTQQRRLQVIAGVERAKGGAP